MNSNQIIFKIKTGLFSDEVLYNNKHCVISGNWYIMPTSNPTDPNSSSALFSAQLILVEYESST